MDIQLVDGKILLIHDCIYEKNKSYESLEKVLNQCRSLGRLEIEIKTLNTDIFVPLRQLINQYAPIDIELTSSELPLIPFIHQAFPEFRVGAIFGKNHYEQWMTEDFYLQKTVSYLQLLSAQVAHLGNLPLRKVTRNLVRQLHQHGFHRLITIFL